MSERRRWYGNEIATFPFADQFEYVLASDYDALLARSEKAERKLVEAEEALKDAIGALRYIVETYGHLYGVGWERVFGHPAVRRALEGEER